MAKKSGGSTNLIALRRRAEKLLKTTRQDIAAMPIKDVQRLVHELQVHQIELEMQNEALRLAQAEIEESRDRYADLYDGASTGYLSVDPRGVVLKANLPACRLLGINRNDLLGKPAIRFVAAKDQAMFHRHIRELFSTGVKQVCEVELAQEGNVPAMVQFESVAVLDEAGPTHMRTTLLDITERVRAVAAFQVWQQGIHRQQTLEERGRLSHDLHDGILQSLFAVGMGLELCRLSLLKTPNKAQHILGKSIGELNSVIRETRTFIEELESEAAPGIAPPADLPGTL